MFIKEKELKFSFIVSRGDGTSSRGRSECASFLVRPFSLVAAKPEASWTPHGCASAAVCMQRVVDSFSCDPLWRRRGRRRWNRCLPVAATSLSFRSSSNGD
ncbi:hypothetical protein L596_014982 [Steinernema carpocapsae]|uniref:Uncharacterized protein n=1 Tax=Steinernema carpocapsae TaxID=34508 RepID=A0A4U5NDU7_STECR|nr:hypothetical protein L596_014982 [Steinernema carpocapsae]